MWFKIEIIENKRKVVIAKCSLCGKKSKKIVLSLKIIFAHYVVEQRSCNRENS